jgi:predicted nuclease of predicted toxin-antitoxin system
MRFKADENLHPAAAEYLCEHGHDAVTIWEEDLQGSDDAGIIERCRLEKRALLTLDTGFGDVRTYRPEDYHGIVVLRLDNPSRKRVLAVLPRLIELIKAEALEKHLWVVDEGAIRIRGSEAD